MRLPEVSGNGNSSSRTATLSVRMGNPFPQDRVADCDRTEQERQAEFDFRRWTAPNGTSSAGSDPLRVRLLSCGCGVLGAFCPPARLVLRTLCTVLRPTTSVTWKKKKRDNGLD